MLQVSFKAVLSSTTRHAVEVLEPSTASSGSKLYVSDSARYQRCMYALHGVLELLKGSLEQGKRTRLSVTLLPHTGPQVRAFRPMLQCIVAKAKEQTTRSRFEFLHKHFSRPSVRHELLGVAWRPRLREKLGD